MSSPPLVLAHRGASAVEPENTLAAFRAALALGADGVELDVHRTAAGALAVHHDATQADGRAVAELTAATWPDALPTLAAALDTCRGRLVNIEIKDHAATQVVALLRARGGADRVLVSSFDAAVVARVHALEPALPTAQLTFELPDPRARVADVAAAGHVALHPWDGTVDAALVDAAHEAGLAVNVWTVDRPERIAELARLGVDGIVTNTPDVARGVLAELVG